MIYQKIVENGYIVSLAKGVTNGNITEQEYNAILAVIQSRPEADGKGYLLREDLTWDEYDLPQEVDAPEEMDG